MRSEQSLTVNNPLAENCLTTNHQINMYSEETITQEIHLKSIKEDHKLTYYTHLPWNNLGENTAFLLLYVYYRWIK